MILQGESPSMLIAQPHFPINIEIIKEVKEEEEVHQNVQKEIL